MSNGQNLCVLKNFKKCRNFKHTLKAKMGWDGKNYPNNDEDWLEELVESASKKLETEERLDKLNKAIKGRIKLNTLKPSKEEKCKDAKTPEICEKYWRDTWK